ncbi:MAG: energy transducer TonB [Sphingobacteriales bacterium]|nr:MAG: energy transducer TonB [Sphingobacteriales bacterium]
MFAPEEIDKRTFTEILFEGRNKKYGAYLLRKQYYRHVFTGLALSVSVVVLGLIIPYIYGWLKPDPTYTEQENLVEVNVLPPPPEVLTLEYAQASAPKPDEEIVPEITKDSVIVKKTVKPKPKPIEQTASADTSQNNGAGSPNGSGAGSGDDVFVEVDEVPVPPGGSLSAYLSKHLHYPEREKTLNIQGKVYISCIVNRDGTLQDVKVVQGVSDELNAEALRVVKAMPAWQPAKRKGLPVRMITKFAINFTLKR